MVSFLNGHQSARCRIRPFRKEKEERERKKIEREEKRKSAKDYTIVYL